MRMEMIRLEHVTKSFGRYKALDDVSIVVEEGEFLTVIGRSGCGKTTMLRKLMEGTDRGYVSLDDPSDDKRIAKAGFGKSICGRGRRRRGRFDPASKKDRLRDTK